MERRLLVCGEGGERGERRGRGKMDLVPYLPVTPTSVRRKGVLASAIISNHFAPLEHKIARQEDDENSPEGRELTLGALRHGCESVIEGVRCG